MKTQNLEVVEVDHLRTFYLSFGRALAVSDLEAQLHLPFRTVRWWLSGKRSLPAHHRAALLRWARRYGYQEDIQYDQFL